MARPKKQTVDYFSHDCIHKKTMFIIERKFGNNGYAFWFKLLEILGSTDGHYFDLKDDTNKEFLQAKTYLGWDLCEEILNKLALLGAIDDELWKNKIVWSDNFIERVALVYKNRRAIIPKKPVKTSVQTNNYNQKLTESKVSTDKNSQSKVKESKVKEIKEEPKFNNHSVEELNQNFNTDDFKQFDIDNAKWWMKWTKNNFPTVNRDIIRFAKEIHDLRVLDRLEENKIVSIQNYLEKKIYDNGFSWSEQIGTPGKLRQRSKRTEEKYYSMILKEINRKVTNEKRPDPTNRPTETKEIDL